MVPFYSSITALQSLYHTAVSHHTAVPQRTDIYIGSLGSIWEGVPNERAFMRVDLTAVTSGVLD